MRIHKTFLFIILSISSPVWMGADAAPVQQVPGSNLIRLISNSTIRLQDERIQIDLYPKSAEVSVEYTFVNEGIQDDVIMGFPNWSVPTAFQPVKDFTAFEGDRRLEVFPAPLEDGSEWESRWLECFEVSFKKGETKQIRNHFSQKYSNDYLSHNFTFTYILSTGAMWHGSIDRVDVEIRFNDMDVPSLDGRVGYFAFDLSRQLHWSGLRVLPEGFKINEEKKNASMTFHDIDPNFDIEVLFSKPLQYFGIEASSVLQGNDPDYSPVNVSDGDPATAWVEGTAGPGIGEFIRLGIDPYEKEVSGFYGIKRIGIINGYARDKELYFANNRVKSIEFSHTFSVLGDYHQIRDQPVIGIQPYVFDLDESMEYQFLEFPRPVPVSEFTLTILDVYPGSRWDDTCIAEILVETAPLSQEDLDPYKPF